MATVVIMWLFFNLLVFSDFAAVHIFIRLLAHVVLAVHVQQVEIFLALSLFLSRILLDHLRRWPSETPITAVEDLTGVLLLVGVGLPDLL